MRITDANSFNITQRRFQEARSNIEKSAEAVYSGKKVNNLGDDPLVLQYQLRNDKQEADLEQSESTLGLLKSKYNMYEANMEEYYQRLVSFQSTLIQLSNARDDGDIVNTLSAELEGVKDQIMEIANSQQDGQFIFSGARTDVEPFDADGTYLGDSYENLVEILPGIKMEANLTGEGLFGGEGYSDGVNIFEVLNQMAEQLEHDPQGAASDYLNDINQAVDQIIQERTSVGARLTRIDLSQNTLSKLKLTLEEKRQNIEAVDYVTAVTEYQQQEYALEATLQTNSNIMQMTLMDYIR